MKKTIRKMLIVLAIVTVAVVMMSFASSAVTYCGPGNCRTVEEYVEPTCLEPGYTKYTCYICGYESRSSETVPAYGHDYKKVEWVFEKEGDHFKKGRTCNRCNETQYETVNGITVTYQLVEFFNPFVAEKYWEDITYTKVVRSHKQPQLLTTGGGKEYGKWYVKTGTSLVDYIVANTDFTDERTAYRDWIKYLTDTKLCLREKDKNFGKYDLVGFTAEPKDSGEFTDADTFDFATVINANTKLYAAFTGDPYVKYDVKFVNPDGRPEAETKFFEVYHGTKADDSIYKPVLDEKGSYILDEKGSIQYTNPQLYMAENANFYYTFKGWSVDHTEIYGDVTIAATYNAIPKAYDYELYVWDAASNAYVTSNVKAEGIVYGSPLVYSNLPAGKTIADVVARDKDRSYVYIWNKKFTIMNTGHSFGENFATTLNGYKDTRYRGEEGYSPIIIVPSYDRTPNLYRTRVVIKFDRNVSFAQTSSKEYEMEQYLNGVTVQITDAKGQLMSTGTANLVPGTDYAEYNCYLYDSASYTVTAVSPRNKYTGSSTINRTTVFDFDAPVNFSIGLTLNSEYLEAQSCKCIHHNTLFQPLWVRILNLLYRLFNVRYVCCDDMFSTIGGLLVYTK